MSPRHPIFPALQYGVLFALMAASAAAEHKVFDTTAETTHRRITWDDFKGKGFTGSRWQGGAWAHLVSGIEVDPYRMEPRQLEDGGWIVDPPSLEAYGVMDKLLSGVARGAAADHVLVHEQLHFDVTEAFARRLTVRLWTLEGRGRTAESAMEDLQEQVEEAFEDATRRLQAYQQRYDEETAHGTRRKVQKKWSQKVAELFAAATAELEAAGARR